MTDRERLHALLTEKSFRRGTFTLTSGKTSDFFIDVKPSVLGAEGHVLVGNLLLEALARVPSGVSAVAGVELGGCPLASAVAVASFHAKRPLDAVYVRKAAKGHGTKKLLEGADALPKGARLVILEDTVTTGGSTLRAVASIREAGFEVSGVLAVVDRTEGGADAIREAGLYFASLFVRADFMGDA
jgi:orotate phosphoribosyltransferase